MDLNEALEQFDRTEVNLRRLEKVNAELERLIPGGIVFAGGSPDGRQHESLRRAFADLAQSLPAINGFRLEAEPWSLDEIAQARFEAAEVDFPEAHISVSQALVAPAEAIDLYRHRFERSRRHLVRKRLAELIDQIDLFLSKVTPKFERGSESVADDSDWKEMKTSFLELRRLVGAEGSRDARWPELARHLSFAQGTDLHDIAEHDWPSVRRDVESRQYSEDEPLPIEIEDLGDMAADPPAGKVTTELNWASLDDEAFERLIFNLISDAAEYENPRWMTNTKAPDRGRDLTAERVIADSLSGTSRQRVVFECKDWSDKPISATTVGDAVTKAGLWDPPFDVLVVATSGRFSIDAVAWIENHNRNNRLRVEPWPNSHLEDLLATRPHLIEEFKLRL